MIAGLVAGLVAGAVAGVLAGLLVAGTRGERRVAAARAELAAATAEAGARIARLEAELEQERAAAADRQAAWDEARQQLAGAFAELSSRALTQNNEQFLQLATAALSRAQQAAVGELDLRKQAIEQLLAPLREQLGRYEHGLRQLEAERKEAYVALREQVKHLSESQDQLQRETRNLVTALRAPATRGRWGELQLRRVVEMAGMVEHCDFSEQVTTGGDDGRLRPDLVVHLPGDKHVVVDAKVPLQAFLDAVDAPDEDTRRLHLVNHARQLRVHVDALSKRDYWQQFDNSPEFVVAFVPGDPLLAAALEQDPALLDHAVAGHVLLATPTTLIALLWAVAYGWQQQALADSARQVQQLGRELYRRLSVFGEHLARTGRNLASAVESYNKAVGSLERSVLRQARRFQELGVVGGADRELPEPEPLDAAPRPLQAPELLHPPVGPELADEHPELPGAAGN